MVAPQKPISEGWPKGGNCHPPKTNLDDAPRVDARCTWKNCSLGNSKDTYQLVGYCMNCSTEPIVATFTVGHEAQSHVLGEKCPVCQCKRLYWRGSVDRYKREVKPLTGTRVTITFEQDMDEPTRGGFGLWLDSVIRCSAEDDPESDHGPFQITIK